MTTQIDPHQPLPNVDGVTVLELLGSGGQAVVYLCRTRSPDRIVAVKVLIDTAIGSGAFELEANLLASVSSHPSIVTIYDAGIDRDDRPYIVMEYCPGADFLRRSESASLSVSEVLQVGVQIGCAVQSAHQRGILHLDIKPANLLTNEYGRPVLADFGLARIGVGEAELGGSVPWAAPEVFTDEPIDARTDVYSLGATLYHLLSGRPPFAVPGGRSTSVDHMMRGRYCELPAIGRDDVPVRLERLLRHVMAKQPSDRPPDTVSVARALNEIEEELGVVRTRLDLPMEVRPPIDFSTQVGETRRATPPEIVVGRSRPDVGHVPDHPPSAAVNVPTPRPDSNEEPRQSRPPASPTENLAGTATEPSRGPSSPTPERTIARRVVPVLACAALGLVGLYQLLVRESGAADSSPEVVRVAESADVVAPIAGLVGAADGGVVSFTWADSQPADQTYRYTVSVDGRAGPTGTSAEPVYAFEPTRGWRRVCIDVSAEQVGRVPSGTSRACVGSDR